MTPKQYTRTLKRYIDYRFDTQKQAAEWFGVSQPQMSLVLMGERSPNDAMLEATGYEERKTVTIQYLRTK
tara:strand:+ start:22 stop:231 length:210 start_codon:yes stop_codon:yes gene_type:complete